MLHITVQNPSKPSLCPPKNASISTCSFYLMLTSGPTPVAYANTDLTYWSWWRWRLYGEIQDQLIVLLMPWCLYTCLQSIGCWWALLFYRWMSYVLFIMRGVNWKLKINTSILLIILPSLLHANMHACDACPANLKHSYCESCNSASISSKTP